MITPIDSTAFLASARPRPVASLTTLITAILLAPMSLRTTSNSVFSSAAGAASAAPPTAATATGAASEFENICDITHLTIEFEDGMISGYHCSNFASEEENIKYIKENVLYNHESLPMGEFAIGTNTTAYMVGRKYDINDRLPILIAEKTGPHFAVGDTCYSWAEDTKVYNSDGREIIPRDNEVSILRKEDVSNAYFNCHTDITIPYDELGEITVNCKDGRRITIIENGRFVLPGCEELNKPFDIY